jgi:hypothetical protein
MQLRPDAFTTCVLQFPPQLPQCVTSCICSQPFERIESQSKKLAAHVV